MMVRFGSCLEKRRGRYEKAHLVEHYPRIREFVSPVDWPALFKSFPSKINCVNLTPAMQAVLLVQRSFKISTSVFIVGD